MKFVRFLAEGEARYGILEGDTIKEVQGSIFEEYSETGKTYALSAVKLLIPCEPSKVIAIGKNYMKHIQEMNSEVPKELFPFWKPLTCLIAPGEEIVIHHPEHVNHHEAEAVVVIGKTCSKVSKEEALDYVFGVTCGNDVSDRTYQRSEHDACWMRAKGSDTFGPLGPCIATGLDPDNLDVICRVNGEVKQSSNTSDFIFDTATQISVLSQEIVLSPGDVIYTGTPSGVGVIKPGDTVEIEVEGVGVLSNPVVGP